jgi:chemotaxis protein CheD
MENVRSVGFGEMVVSDMPGDVLIAYGLGSCVAVCLYDREAGVAGMLHALLPQSSGSQGAGNPLKFVDLGVPNLAAELLRRGAERNRVVAALCGGAEIVSLPGKADVLSIGKRNVAAAQAALRSAGFRVQAQECGGNTGRTVRLFVADGRITVRQLGQSEATLVQSGSYSRVGVQYERSNDRR